MAPTAPLTLPELVASRLGDYGPLVDTFEGYLYTASEHLGLAVGTNPPHVYWFRRPIVHVIEWIGFHIFVLVLFWLAGNFYKRVVRPLSVSRDTLSESLVDRLLGSGLAVCLTMQVIYKSLRTNAVVQIWWILMPCHVVSIMWVIVLLTKRKGHERRRQACLYLATLGCACEWAPLAALATPDYSDHNYIHEIYLFWGHHFLLAIVPFYWIARYPLLPMSKAFFIHLTAWATWMNIGPYTLVAYVTGLNLNYMLAPPRGLQRKVPIIWDTPAYRVNTVAGLILLSVLSRICMGLFSRLFRTIEKLVGLPPRIVEIPLMLSTNTDVSADTDDGFPRLEDEYSNPSSPLSPDSPPGAGASSPGLESDSSPTTAAVKERNGGLRQRPMRQGQVESPEEEKKEVTRRSSQGSDRPRKAKKED